ncbi:MULTISPECIES: hypothetical protein [unclassified Acinetobacter]|uniref:hypothetical protein n=1 Tax=unclassified Acinetobacter TaxID=196816 RepID=UPI00244D2A44|nr:MULTISPECIES: hypothetical protein [unclassified Acinetobacter]MDH0030635.1 hypothetical protein [Acinetobacter sp. GD04021]MDH0886254.1 hypothetical protein [Acinetobacter sp. GD03873]MDH1081771.1 hypothetical protein [Acinetobacter sp. GD03983]MDH2189731.1 hypothetical protein [Acinetobacter sp. GD03645]MDH2202723.1 hypothetical protein [Acinetobacter sp. GD03647]
MNVKYITPEESKQNNGTSTEKGIKYESQSKITYFEDLDTEVIVIDCHKLDNILTNHLSKRASLASWQLPLSFFITFFIAFLTTDFKYEDRISNTLDGILICLILMTLIWTVRQTFLAIKNRSKETLIEQIKKNCKSI